MTRTRTIATLWCTALAATLAAYGCGSSSTVETGTGGKTGGGAGSTGAGGGVIIITNVGGMTGGAGTNGGTGGMTGGGMGGMVGPPMDAGAPMCRQNAMCTAPFTCTATCNAGGGRGLGTMTCNCRNAGTLNCGACTPNDAGVPPPPMDAAPRDVAPPVDAGPMCAGNVRTGTVCTVGMSLSPCARANGSGQICTCAEPPADAARPADAGADAAPPPPPRATYTCM